MTAFVLTFAYFAIVGAGFLLLIGGRITPARTFLFGVGAAGTLLFIAGAAHLELTAGRFLAVPFIAATGFFFRFRRSPAVVTRLARLPVALAAIAIAVTFADAALLPLRDYDGRTFWTLKAKAIAHERSITGPFFQGLGARNLHNHYPLLVPLDVAAVLSILGDEADENARWLFALVGVALVLLVAEGVSAAASPPVGAWCAVAVAFLPLVGSAPEGSAISAYADLPFAAFAAAAFFDLDELHRSGRTPPTLQFWLVFLVLTKNEGIVIAAAVLVMACMRARSAKLVIGPLLAFALLAVWRHSVPNAYDENYAALLPLLPSRMSRIGSAATALLARMFELKSWALFWPAAIAGGFLSFRRSRPIIMGMAAILAAYALAYTLTSWNIGELAAVSANRLLLHLVGPAALLIAFGFAAVRDGNGAQAMESGE